MSETQEDPYPEVTAEWEILTYTNKDGLLPATEIDWEVKILVGSLTNAEQLNEDLKHLILKQEERLVKHTDPSSDGSTMLDDTHLTTRFKNWNVHYLDHPSVELLWNYISEGFQNYVNIHDVKIPKHSPLSVQSWGNVLRAGEDIGQHCHASKQSTCLLSTNYCVTADESTATVYDLPGYEAREAHIENEPGQLVLFPPWLPHYTTEFTHENEERITIASDISLVDCQKASFTPDGERESHWLPFDKSPRRKKREAQSTAEWGEVPGVDGTIARLVNYNGELTEELVREMKEKGTDFAKKHLRPEGYDSEQESVLPEEEATFSNMEQ